MVNVHSLGEVFQMFVAESFHMIAIAQAADGLWTDQELTGLDSGPPPSCSACPAPANATQRRAPPGSGLFWRGSRSALGGTEEPCVRWGGRRGMLERRPPAGGALKDRLIII